MGNFFCNFTNLVVVLADRLENHWWNPTDVSVVLNDQVGPAAHQVVPCGRQNNLVSNSYPDHPQLSGGSSLLLTKMAGDIVEEEDVRSPKPEYT